MRPLTVTQLAQLETEYPPAKRAGWVLGRCDAPRARKAFVEEYGEEPASTIELERYWRTGRRVGAAVMGAVAAREAKEPELALAGAGKKAPPPRRPPQRFVEPAEPVTMANWSRGKSDDEIRETMLVQERMQTHALTRLFQRYQFNASAYAYIAMCRVIDRGEATRLNRIWKRGGIRAFVYILAWEGRSLKAVFDEDRRRIVTFLPMERSPHEDEPPALSTSPNPNPQEVNTMSESPAPQPGATAPASPPNGTPPAGTPPVTALALAGPAAGAPPPAAAPTTGLAVIAEEMPRVDAERFMANVDALMRIRKHVLDLLVEGKDYGKMAGVDRPFLYAPGAAKIAIGFTVYPKREPAESYLRIVDDPTRTWKDDQGNEWPTFYAESRVDLLLRGSNVLMHQGEWRRCSIAEKRFRAQLIKHENSNRKWVEAVPLESLKGAIIDTAQKRGFVHGVREFAGLGDSFEQDDDRHDELGRGQELRDPKADAIAQAAQPRVATRAAAPARPAPRQAAPAQGGGEETVIQMATQEQMQRLLGLCRTRNTNLGAVCAAKGMKPPLTQAMADELLKGLAG